MIGVIIPAHNEAASIGTCVRSVCAATEAPELRGEKVTVIVVADDCYDHTETFALWAGAVVLSVFKRNVGHARAIGAELAIAYGARWLSFTDADSEVAPDWLAEQQRSQKDAVCGVVNVQSWDSHPATVRQAFYESYQDIDGHRHIHGANLGCSVPAYRKAGGFQPLTFNEDVALVDALIATGASIAWTNRVRVITSARLESRAPWGFGATLRATTACLAQSTASILGENTE
jgi:glycosyltransferase involved in cell wall biosynthesis